MNATCISMEHPKKSRIHTDRGTFTVVAYVNSGIKRGAFVSSGPAGQLTKREFRAVLKALYPDETARYLDQHGYIAY